MTEQPPSQEPPELEPFEFQLPSGYKIRLATVTVLQQPLMEDFLQGARPLAVCVLRVYCNQDHLLNRMVLAHEFHAPPEFDPVILPTVWDWLARFVADRQHLDFDSLDDFLEALENELAQETFVDEDAVEHIGHLPELCEPEAFDQEDDSIHNDQNEPAGLDAPRTHP